MVNQEDPNWWQAVREGEKGITAGIIPSQKLRERFDHSFKFSVSGQNAWTISPNLCHSVALEMPFQYPQILAKNHGL